MYGAVCLTNGFSAAVVTLNRLQLGPQVQNRQHHEQRSVVYATCRTFSLQNITPSLLTMPS